MESNTWAIFPFSIVEDEVNLKTFNSCIIYTFSWIWCFIYPQMRKSAFSFLIVIESAAECASIQYEFLLNKQSILQNEWRSFNFHHFIIFFSLVHRLPPSAFDVEKDYANGVMYSEHFSVLHQIHSEYKSYL